MLYRVTTRTPGGRTHESTIAAPDVERAGAEARRELARRGISGATVLGVEALPYPVRGKVTRRRRDRRTIAELAQAAGLVVDGLPAPPGHHLFAVYPAELMGSPRRAAAAAVIVQGKGRLRAYLQQELSRC